MAASLILSSGTGSGRGNDVRILIITTCTGEKAVRHDQALTLADFQQGAAHVASRHDALTDLLRPAEEMYTGQQHVRLMRGVRALRTTPISNRTPSPTIDLFILSGGYGFIPGDRPIAPYECTLSGMGGRALRAWAAQLQAPATFRQLLRRPYDLALVLLSDPYLEACSPDRDVQPAGPVLQFCSGTAARKLPALPRLRAIGLSRADAGRFRCGLVGLKGEVAGRLLEWLAADPAALPRVTDPTADLLALLERPSPSKRRPGAARPNPGVDRVITIPPAWWQRPQKTRLSYFIPDWDDLVDPDYDFLNDEHSHGRGHWTNNVYAHQLYPEPAYDGILVSRLVAEENDEKKERLEHLGVHRFFRVPDTFPIMGDCGAFGYIQEDVPPYQTGEILDYYTRLGFDFGVSIDHLIVAETEGQRQKRYQLTIQNAENFLREHRRRGLRWQPIGAVQGWDAASYARAARQYVKMGYRYIALGGLVRSKTADILRIVEAVHEVLPDDIRVHLFGLARFAAIREFVRLGVTSIDSSSVLRKAWLGSTTNFLTESGWYSAIRIPQVRDCFRAKRLVEAGELTAEQLLELERECLAAVRAYGSRQRRLTSWMLDRLTEYDTLLAGERKGTRERIRRTLEDRPWEMCGCAICARWGVEVAVFRGNNRNRRRGFHNTHVFYRLIGRILEGERIGWIDKEQPAARGRSPSSQP
jgi:hypothetical protein